MLPLAVAAGLLVSTLTETRGSSLLQGQGGRVGTRRLQRRGRPLAQGLKLRSAVSPD